MKTRETKQKDLTALTEELKKANSAMVISFNKLKVIKDQEFRNRLRETGAKYQVVKNTLAKIAIKDTPFEVASEHFKGITALAWTEGDAVILSKTVTKFVKENKDFYTFKAGVVEGRVYDVNQVEAIAGLPSKEELISKLLFVINAQAQRIAMVINAVPRNLAVVIKQIGEGKTDTPAAAAAEPEAAVAEEPVSAETAQPEVTEPVSEQPVEAVEKAEETEQPVEAAAADTAAAVEDAPETPAAETTEPEAEPEAAEEEK